MRHRKWAAGMLGLYSWGVLVGIPMLESGGGLFLLAPLLLLAVGLERTDARDAGPILLRPATFLLVAHPIALLAALAGIQSGPATALEATVGALGFGGYMAAALALTAPRGNGDFVGIALPLGITESGARLLPWVGAALTLVLVFTPMLPSVSAELASAYPGRARLAQATLVSLGCLVCVGCISTYLLPVARAAIRPESAKRQLVSEASFTLEHKATWEIVLAVVMGVAALLALLWKGGL